MIQIERELTEHLHKLTVVNKLPTEDQSAAAYTSAALASWGYAVEGPCFSEAGATADWQVVGRLGPGLPGRVQLKAQVTSGAEGPEARVVALAVLLALCKLLAQHRLRHSLEVVVSGGAGITGCEERESSAPYLTGGELVGSVSLAGPGDVGEPTTVGTSGISPALATDVRRLLVRYPEAHWSEADYSLAAEGVSLLVGMVPGGGASPMAGGVDPGTPRPFRLREATMLGAEIIALFQHRTPETCRAGGEGQVQSMA